MMNDHSIKLSVSETVRRFFTRYDWILVVSAIAGLVIAIIGIPRIDVSTELNNRISLEASIEIAASHLESHGFSTENLHARSFLRRNTTALNALQEEYPRHEIQRAYDTYPRKTLPYHYYEVIFSAPDVNKIGFNELADLVMSGDEEQALQQLISGVGSLVTVFIDMNGRPFELFFSTSNINQPFQINRKVFRESLGIVLPDSIETSQIMFSSLFQELENQDDQDIPFVLINRNQAEQIARHHLKGTLWEQSGITRDTSKTMSLNRDRGTVTMDFVTSGTVLNRLLLVKAEVDAIGNLHRLSAEYVREDMTSVRSSRERVTSNTGAFLLVTLVVLAVIVLLRRFSRGLIDAQPSRFDALVGAIALSIFLMLNATSFFARGEPVGMMQLVGPLFGILFGTLGGWILLFVISVYASSLSQEVWPQKLKQLNLIRKGYLINQPVGMTLIRGVLYGLAMTGALALYFLIVPEKGIIYTQSYVFLSDQHLFSAVFTLASGIFSLMLIMFILLLGVAALVYRKFQKGWITIATITILWAVSGFIPVDAIELVYTIPALLLVGGTIGFIFWRHGPILAIISFLVLDIMWNVIAGLSISHSPDLWNNVFLLFFVIGLISTGFWGLQTNVTSEELPDYTPPYLIEIANRERMVQELKIARQVQLSFLPEATPKVDGLELAANCFAASEVGGDYYDFLTGPDGKLGVVIGDVSGKGIQAAFFMTLIKGFTKSLADGYREPSAFLTRINKLFYENSKRGTFISMIYGVYDRTRSSFRFARAGHNPLILVRASSGTVKMVDSKGLAIGMINDERFGKTLECPELELDKGDIVILYTDGYTEAMNYRHQLYGDNRLLETVRLNMDKSARGMLDSINNDVKRFIGDHAQSDDMTMVVMKVV